MITQVRKSVTIDWTLRESARAKIKVMVKRILNKYGYPPDLQEEAVKTVLQQADKQTTTFRGLALSARADKPMRQYQTAIETLPERGLGNKGSRT